MAELAVGLGASAVVPATSANLGPGFDAFGLALTLVDEVDVEIADTGVVVDVEGEGSETVARDESNLVVQAIRAGFDAIGVAAPGLRVSCRNTIPHGRGLGSSAAAIVAGLRLAVALGGDVFRDRELLGLAAEMEGHPDNVAACLLGGLTIAFSAAGPARAVSLDVHERVLPTVFVPPQPLSTEVARGLLPIQVSHRDAAVNSGRAALLVAAMTTRPDLLFDATEDRLHQTYREPAMPDSIALVDRLRGDGHAAVISGAGPAVLVLSDEAGPPLDPDIWTPAGWTSMRLRVGAGAVTAR